MPNIQIDYSANLTDLVQGERLARAVHDAAIGLGEFPTWGIRTFARAIDDFVVADGAPGRGFIQVMVRIAPGRDLARRQLIAQTLFDALAARLAPHFETRSFGLQLEVQEFDAAVTRNRTTLDRTA